MSVEYSAAEALTQVVGMSGARAACNGVPRLLTATDLMWSKRLPFSIVPPQW
uniref:Uncharacterized protein n=1 Tax=Hyaloperonospora arabidopsidis (strain Emoy2) TaxID=559515 RepID=M4BZG3_HYAAE